MIETQIFETRRGGVMEAQVQETEWVKSAQRGDENALNNLISSYYQPVFAYFYKNTGSYHQSKDLTQEVFIRMAAGISRYKPRAAFKSWLFTIASNHLKNYYRTLSRHPECMELSEEMEAGGAETYKADLKNDVEAALAHLPPEQKEAVILRFYSGFTIKEISGITGALETTVKARIRYALDKLRKELEEYDERGR
ncbi:MAG: RNA polymerase sigma factor [Lachnospiraceae bacterium]|nr:RNA polymerase sigma factor [Lachnospiraceae bacterium]MCM1239784.1 RNA polymerase sigma factor [Lachnospiraceae bacterium]MCM1305325.1 RNA polymerase sigma factor [Butyrivibrio sp.]MCM1345121.1 RNA polymerase sigma factor [Muribaculaceae bacterium]MCM1411638.1 RNA polymerase sigma factor [Lachnospiraceae bacterium]